MNKIDIACEERDGLIKINKVCVNGHVQHNVLEIESEEGKWYNFPKLTIISAEPLTKFKGKTKIRFGHSLIPRYVYEGRGTVETAVIETPDSWDKLLKEGGLI